MDPEPVIWPTPTPIILPEGTPVFEFEDVEYVFLEAVVQEWQRFERYGILDVFQYAVVLLVAVLCVWRVIERIKDM